MNNKRIINNIGISIIMKPISMALSLVYTPLALAFLGDEKNGVWTIILNIISWINYFDIGIGNGLRNRLTEAIANDDKELAQKYVSTAYAGTALVSIIFCTIITLIWNILDLSTFFKINVVGENTDLVVFISVFFVCVNFVLSLSKTAAYSIQQTGIISVVGVADQIIQIAVIILISKIFKQSLFAIAMMYGIVSLFDSIIIYSIIAKKRQFLHPRVSMISKQHMKPLLTLGIGFFALQICTLILNTTDNLLISYLYGSAEVTPYSIVYKVFYMLVQVHGIIIMPMWSAYTEAAAKKNIIWIKKTINYINGITVIFCVGAIIGIFLYEPMAAIWLQRRLNYSKLLIVLVATYMIVQMISNNYASFLCGVGHIKVSTIIAIIGALLNIPLSIFFARYCGMRLSGIIMGSLIVMMISVITLPIVSYRWINERSEEWNSEG